MVKQGALDSLPLGGALIGLRLGVPLHHALPHQLLFDDTRVLRVRVGHLALWSGETPSGSAELAGNELEITSRCGAERRRQGVRSWQDMNSR